MRKILLEKAEQLQQIKSNKGFSLLLKHSTRCPVSSMALNRIESSKELSNVDLDYYYLDLIKHRELSNTIAKDFEVFHESPQILLIKNGECILDASHIDISPNEILELVSS